MIDDFALTVTAPTPSGVPFSLSTAPINLLENPDYTSAFSFNESTQRLLARFRVTEAFATSTDAAVQMFVVAGNTSTFTDKSAVLAAASGTLQIFNSSTYFYGFKAADLTLNRTIDIPFASVANWMQSGLDVQQLRYIGCGISIPNYQAGPTLTAGAVECRIISDSGLHDDNKFSVLRESGMKVV